MNIFKQKEKIVHQILRMKWPDLLATKKRQIIYDKPVFYKPQMSTYYMINFEVVLGLTNEALQVGAK